jgi:hypothetical protein
MKTFWTEETINKAAAKARGLPHHWIQAKKAEFEASTGVKWSANHEHCGFKFYPCDEGIEAVSHEFGVDDLIVDTWRQITKSRPMPYVSYLDIAEWCPELNLKVIMESVKDMEKAGVALRTVDRMGKGVAFKIKDKP